MTLDDYQIAANTTAMYPNKGDNIFYPVLGLIGEYGEVAEAVLRGAETEDIIKESGDALWYISTVCTELKIKLSDIAGSRDVGEPLILLARLAEITKKIMRDDNSVITDTHVVAIRPILADLFFRIKTIIEMHGSTVEKACDINVKKLADRKARNKLQGSGDNR